MDGIDIDACTDLIKMYIAHCKHLEIDTDDEAIIELPDLKGYNNWAIYRDKFLSNLANMFGSRNISLSYTVNNSECVKITQATMLFKIKMINLVDTSFSQANTVNMDRSTPRTMAKFGCS